MLGICCAPACVRVCVCVFFIRNIDILGNIRTRAFWRNPPPCSKGAAHGIHPSIWHLWRRLHQADCVRSQHAHSLSFHVVPNIFAVYIPGNLSALPRDIRLWDTLPDNTASPSNFETFRTRLVERFPS